MLELLIATLAWVMLNCAEDRRGTIRAYRVPTGFGIPTSSPVERRNYFHGVIWNRWD